MEKKADRRNQEIIERHEADTMTKAELDEMRSGADFFSAEELAQLTALQTPKAKSKRVRAGARVEPAPPGPKRDLA